MSKQPKSNRPDGTPEPTEFPPCQICGVGDVTLRSYPFCRDCQHDSLHYKGHKITIASTSVAAEASTYCVVRVEGQVDEFRPIVSNGFAGWDTARSIAVIAARRYVDTFPLPAALERTKQYLEVTAQAMLATPDAELARLAQGNSYTALVQHLPCTLSLQELLAEVESANAALVACPAFLLHNEAVRLYRSALDANRAATPTKLYERRLSWII